MAYLFWNNAVEGLGTVKSSYFIYDEPFATVFTAYFFLGEIISPYVFAGGFFILGGVYLVTCSDRNCFWKRKVFNGQI